MNSTHYPNRVRRGFTLMEMTVVITVLLLMAAFVVPNMLAIRRSRSILDMEAAIQRLPREAHNEAMKSHQAVALRVENNALVMERVPANEDGGSNQELKRVSLGEEFNVTRAQNGKESIDVASWKWTTYPDGSADQGGLEFTEGSQTKSLVLPKQGDYTWQEGNLPEPTEEEWQAGEIEKRATQ